ETAWAQLAAADLGVAMDRIQVRHGDTAAVPAGVGTFGSRSAAVGGSAVHLAVLDVREKARQLAAHLLEAAAADIFVDDGHWQVRGVPRRGVTFAETGIAAYAEGRPDNLEPGLEAPRDFE